MFSSNKWNKKEGSPSSFWRKRQLISLNSSVFIENLPSFERARARARANHAKIEAQKGSAMQLNGITFKNEQRCIGTFNVFQYNLLINLRLNLASMNSCILKISLLAMAVCGGPSWFPPKICLSTFIVKLKATHCDY